MYQAQLRPVVPFTIRGAIWYQGEDDGRNKDYAADLARLIASWRLADIALVKTYGRAERPIFGPMYESHEIKGDKVLVKFKYAYGGLKTVNAGAPNWFEISDGSQENNRLKYVKAQARIAAADVVEVSAPEVKEPKFVRFSWHTLARHNLVNSGGLPAVPFRTDQQDVKGWR